MEHKPNQAGFSLYIILTLILVIVAIGGSYWFVHERQNQNIDSSMSAPAAYQPGIINVEFKDGTTLQQAINLTSTFNLVVKDPNNDVLDFTPVSYRAIKSDQFRAMQAALQKYPEVVSFADDSSDPSSRAGTGYTWIKITWQQSATYSRITAILNQNHVPGYQEDNTFRGFDLTVPDGQENSYINRFKKSSIVKDAGRVGYPQIQNGDLQ